MNRRRRKLIRRLLRAMPRESTVDRHEHAALIEEQVHRAKFPRAAHKRMILLAIVVAALGLIFLLALLVALGLGQAAKQGDDELEVRRRLYPPAKDVDRVEM